MDVANIVTTPTLHAFLPSPQLDDFIPSVEEFYKKKHNGRKLTWHHILSNGVVSTLSVFPSCVGTSEFFLLLFAV